ncbi:MAG: hypothetical protein ACYDAO_09935 [Thermoplasmataceae archaeon]
MRWMFLIAGFFMLLYLIGSAMGAGKIGIIYIIAVADHSISGSSASVGSIYFTGLLIYIIIMIILFALAFLLPDKED